MMVGDRFYHEAVQGYAGRHRVKPGITGYAQVKGLRGEVRTIERAKRRVELDKYYVDNWSFWLDIWILSRLFAQFCSTAMHTDRAEFLDLQFDRLTFNQVKKRLRAATTATSYGYIVTPNVDHMVRLKREPELRPLYEGATLCLCDSRVLRL